MIEAIESEEILHALAEAGEHQAWERKDRGLDDMAFFGVPHVGKFPYDPRLPWE